MDFFGQQDKAKSRSGRIYVLFFVFVILLGLLNAFLVSILLVGTTKEAAEGVADKDLAVPLFTITALLTYVVVFGGSLIQWLQFRGGGDKVATMLGGRCVDRNTKDPAERQLLNIVEEMAIASGMPVPNVYILEEEGVNAFAAGNDPSDAVIGVTKGAMKTFTRDEMQGVVAHEFSHIRNGDMAKNMKLGALVFGIFCLYFIGEMIIRTAAMSGSRSRNSRDGKDGGGALAIMLLGVGMCVLGLLGQLLGRILQMSHSRQREYLADASAVQFTRNPEGIGNALIKLKKLSTRLNNPHSSALNHLFFGESSLSGLLSSHPPLEERIRRILPNWNGDWVASKGSSKVTPEAASAAASAMVGVSGFAGGEHTQVNAKPESVSPLFTIPQEYLFPVLADDVVQLTRELMPARFVLISLLLSDEPDVRNKQYRALFSKLDAGSQQELHKVSVMISQQPAINRFAILERALPTLEQISEAQFQELVRDMDELIAADGRISHWEFLVRQVVLHHFEHNLGYTSPHDLKAPKEKVMSVQAAFGILLRTLCRVAGRDERNAWGVATKVLSNSAIVQFPEDPFPPHWTVLQQSLKRAEHANKRTKVELMNACTAAVQAEGTISLPALDMLRLLSIVMETPIPLSQA